MRGFFVDDSSSTRRLRELGRVVRNICTERRASRCKRTALLALAALTFAGCGASASTVSGHVDANAASRALIGEAERLVASRQDGAAMSPSVQFVTPATATLATADVCVSWGNIEADLATGKSSPTKVQGEAQALAVESDRAATSDPGWEPLANAITQWKADLGTTAALTSDYNRIEAICHAVPAADLIAAQRANDASKG